MAPEDKTCVYADGCRPAQDRLRKATPVPSLASSKNSSHGEQKVRLHRIRMRHKTGDNVAHHNPDESYSFERARGSVPSDTESWPIRRDFNEGDELSVDLKSEKLSEMIKPGAEDVEKISKGASEGKEVGAATKTSSKKSLSSEVDKKSNVTETTRSKKVASEEHSEKGKGGGKSAKSGGEPEGQGVYRKRIRTHCCCEMKKMLRHNAVGQRSEPSESFSGCQDSSDPSLEFHPEGNPILPWKPVCDLCVGRKALKFYNDVDRNNYPRTGWCIDGATPPLTPPPPPPPLTPPPPPSTIEFQQCREANAPDTYGNPLPDSCQPSWGCPAASPRGPCSQIGYPAASPSVPYSQVGYSTTSLRGPCSQFGYPTTCPSVPYSQLGYPTTESYSMGLYPHCVSRQEPSCRRIF